MEKLGLVSHSRAAIGVFWEQSILNLYNFYCLLEMPSIALG